MNEQYEDSNHGLGENDVCLYFAASPGILQDIERGISERTLLGFYDESSAEILLGLNPHLSIVLGVEVPFEVHRRAISLGYWSHREFCEGAGYVIAEERDFALASGVSIDSSEGMELLSAAYHGEDNLENLLNRL